MYYCHALPDNWEAMPYHDFLVERRERIAAVIRDAYKQLSVGTEAQDPAATVPLAEMVAGGETTNLEFKSTLRVNLHTGKPDSRIELSALKTIAGFLNTRGGNYWLQ